MSDVLYENEGWDKDRMAELARALQYGAALLDDVQELARLALRAWNELGRLRHLETAVAEALGAVHRRHGRPPFPGTEGEMLAVIASLRAQRDEVVKRIVAPCDRCGHSVEGRLRLALTPLPSETVADAAERVAKERIAYEQAAETAEKRASKLEQQRAVIVRERDEAVERADAAGAYAKRWRTFRTGLECALDLGSDATDEDILTAVAQAQTDAKLWRGATATLPLTADALGKVLYESDGLDSWSSCPAKDGFSADAAAVARAVMAALSSDAAANAAWDGSWGKPSGWWTGLLASAAKAALALPEQETPQPQQAEAPKLEWSPGFPVDGDYDGRYAFDLRRNVEAIDERLRKLEGSR